MSQPVYTQAIIIMDHRPTNYRLNYAEQHIKPRAFSKRILVTKKNKNTLNACMVGR